MGRAGLLEDAVSWWREHTRTRRSHAIASAVTEAQRVVGEQGWPRLISPRLIIPDPSHQCRALQEPFAGLLTTGPLWRHLQAAAGPATHSRLTEQVHAVLKALGEALGCNGE